MNSFGEDVVAKIIAAGKGVAVGTDIFTSTRASIPSNGSSAAGPFTSVLDTGGPEPVRRHNRVTNPYQRSTLQIVVRATSAVVAKAKARELFALFVGIRNMKLTTGGPFYLEITPTQSEPFDMDLDEIGRSRFGFNLRALKTFS